MRVYKDFGRKAIELLVQRMVIIGLETQIDMIWMD